MKSLFLLSELQNWVYYFSMMRNSRINGKSMLDHNLFHAIKTNISLSFMFTNLQILLELDQTFWSVVRFMMLRSASFLCHFQTLSEFWILLIHLKPFKRTQMLRSSCHELHESHETTDLRNKSSTVAQNHETMCDTMIVI